jgi:transaldolase
MRELFLDTANLESIRNYHSKGIISGVTTNPSLISKEPKQNFDQLIEQIWMYCASNGLSLSVEVFAVEPKAIVEQAFSLTNQLFNIFHNRKLLYIKIPIGLQELDCIRYLSELGININCTCGYTATQMQLAALAGAKYVSVFYNRAKDSGIDSLNSIKQIRQFIDTNNLDTKIIAGSIRTPSDISDTWQAGADIVTCGPKIIDDSVFHEGTQKSVEGFIKDFNNWI